jgi:hypothetical protein
LYRYTVAPAPAPAAAPAAAAEASAAPPAIAPTVSVAECLKKLQTADNGLLYEDPYIQIGVGLHVESS